MAIHYIQVKHHKQSIAFLPTLPFKPKVLYDPQPTRFLLTQSGLGLSLLLGSFLLCYSGQLFALEEADKVRELAGLTAETSRLVKNGCYIAGSASALVGAIWSVASQSLKVATSSAAITIVALKAAGFFAGTLFI